MKVPTAGPRAARTARGQAPPRGARRRAAACAAALLLAQAAAGALASPGGAASVVDPAIDPLGARLAACTACHGPQGRASSAGYLPRIAGKPAAYLYHQLLNFREGRRPYAAMKRLLEPLSDDYLWQIAMHFAAQDLPYPAPAAVQLTPLRRQRGQALARDGDPGLGVPACTRCHGERLTGRLPAAPGLLGLPRDYLLAQLGGWRTGERRAHAPDCMADIVRRLGDADLAAAAAWLAAQPLPADARPAPANAAGPAASAPLRPTLADCGAARRP